MTNDRLFRIGLLGTLITGLCCFTPLLAYLLAVVGLVGLVPLFDSVLFPALGVFLALMVYALWKQLTAHSN